MNAKRVKKLRKRIKDKYDEIQFDKAPFNKVWKMIKKGIKNGTIKEGDE